MFIYIAFSFQTIIHDSNTAEVYATEEISPNHESILADLDFSENGQYAYVLTPSKVNCDYSLDIIDYCTLLL